MRFPKVQLDQLAETLVSLEYVERHRPFPDFDYSKLRKAVAHLAMSRALLFDVVPNVEPKDKR